MTEATAGKSCFVISPIGEEGSEVREHADDVFDYVISPAVERAGYLTHRADHLKKPGLITEQMYRSIFEADLLVAIITFRNPNVFYELAIAQAAARPVVILNLKGHPIPFDIKDIRILEYDLKPRALMEGKHAESLLAAILEIEKAPPVGVVFDRNLTPLRSGKEATVYYDNAEEVSPQTVADALEGARERVWLMGLSQYWWFKRPNVMETIRRLAATPGFDFRVLVMDETNPALPMMIRDSDSQLSVVRSEIEASRRQWMDLADRLPGLQFRQVRRGLPMSALNLTDRGALYLPYLVSASSRLSPAVVCGPEHPIYRKMEVEFAHLWDLNQPA